MIIRFIIIVPPHVARNTLTVVAYVQAYLPTGVSLNDLSFLAEHGKGLTIGFDLEYAALEDAVQGLAVFFAETGKIPEPPAP